MTRLFLECAIRAALMVTGTAIVLYAMRVKAAGVKHRVWTAVVLLMLLLPAWTAWGPKAPVRVLPPSTERTAIEAIGPTDMLPAADAQPGGAGVKIPEPTRPLLSGGQEVLLGIYLLGFLLLLARLAIGTSEAHRLIQQATLRDGMHTGAFCAAPVTVGWLYPTVILPHDWRQWPQAQLNAVLTHEREHARRRDPLVQWLALLNRAVFWFHPAAWWLEGELSSLAEEACDSAVLARGYDAREYAETLVEMARAVMRSGARVNVVGVAMPGGCLTQRIRQIIEVGPAPRISRTRMACVAAACAITCVAFAAGGLDRAQAPTAQSSTGDKPAFEVASVRPNRSQDPGGHLGIPAGRFTATNVTTKELIKFAYNGKQSGFSLRDDQVSGGPSWINSDRFDIDAKEEDSIVKGLKKLTYDQALDQIRSMVQSLLEDRFRLNVSHATRELPVYVLVVAKSGPRLTQSTVTPLGPPGSNPPGSAPQKGPLLGVKAGQITGVGMRVGPLAEVLSRQPELGGRMVLDQTGLKDTYDFTLHWTPENLTTVPNGPDGSQPPANTRSPDSSAPSIFTAIQEQLGLRLESTKGPVDVLVIDHVEEPSPN